MGQGGTSEKRALFFIKRALFFINRGTFFHKRGTFLNVLGNAASGRAPSRSSFILRILNIDEFYVAFGDFGSFPT